MKVTYAGVLARKILITFLAFAIIFSIAALFVRSTITERLANISKLANAVERDQHRPEQALLLLHQAEDDFQESLLTENSKKNIGYKDKLSQAFKEIDTLLKENTGTAQLTSAQSNKVKFWHQKKLDLSDKLFVLKHDFDSLLTVYANFNTQAGNESITVNTNVHSSKISVNNQTDTLKKPVATVKKGFFKRIKEAISNKNNKTQPAVIEINRNNNRNVTDLITSKIAESNRNAYAKKLKQLQSRNVKLLSMQRQLIALNTHISNELEYIINDVKDINYNIADELKGAAFKNYQETTALLNKFYLAALFLVVVFATLLIVYIVQLNKSELLLRKENERSVTIAQQKMDLLLHMSHEIRNPLTAIKGFLYIFSQTPLSQKQAEMLSSIRNSSDMLLQTLNDTLDAAKMENSEFKINNDPFNPDFALKQVIEGMCYSASKKSLTVDYSFKGDNEVMVLGDSFRLKQIMVNLLSNAIKYTNTGGITVTAELKSGENGLHVDVSDTGMGISLEQQSNLFSKYYQTSSSKGQVGTGLGLFICKQLINLQNGKISVKSNPGTGTTFSFFIPYQKIEAGSIVKDTDDPLSLLNGINILAVDDNELNLMFLKMMTNKWNIKFHQAADGKEALNIISKNSINMVLTDIQMPGMDGNELLTAIRALDSPLNSLPVIVISGASKPEDEREFLKQGFSGFVSKPFIEADLIAQLVKVIKK